MQRPERRNEVVPHPVARMGAIGVACVLTPGDGRVAQSGADLVTAEVGQRPDPAGPIAGRKCRERRPARRGGKAIEDRLDAIVAVVARRDRTAVCVRVGGGAPRVARSAFDARAARNGSIDAPERDAEPGRQGRARVRVGLALVSAQRVRDVQRLAPVPEPDEHMQEQGGIGAARDHHEHARGRGEQPLAGDCGRDSLRQAREPVHAIAMRPAYVMPSSM